MTSGTVVDVSGWERSEPEPMGKKRKQWLIDPDGTRWLFKEPRETGGTVRGEDWAEFITAGIFGLLELPAAVTRLAVRDGQRGIISKQFSQDHGTLIHGNELLAGELPGYEKDVTGENPLYSIANVVRTLDTVSAPKGWSELGFSGADLWLSYLVVDAVVANTDRHHANWAVVETDDERLELAPSFDHGSSLGFAESDRKKRRLLADSSRLARWCDKGAARPLAGKPKLRAVAVDAVAAMTPNIRDTIRRRIGDLSLRQLELLIIDVPDGLMSEVSRIFAVRVVAGNRRRLLDVFGSAR